MGGPSGHPSVGEHLRYVQHTIMTHHQPVRRVSDNVAVTHQTLFDSEDVALDAMYDVDFRGGGHGKFVWTSDGVDYLKQYLPPSMRDLESTPEYIIAQMDYAGVDRAVIQSGHLYGRLNEYIAEAVRRYPDRLWGPRARGRVERRRSRRGPVPRCRHQRAWPSRPVVQHRLARDAPPRHPRRRSRLLPVLGPCPGAGHPHLLERDNLSTRPRGLHVPASGLQALARHLPRHSLAS